MGFAAFILIEKPINNQVLWLTKNSKAKSQPNQTPITSLATLSGQKIKPATSYATHTDHVR